MHISKVYDTLYAHYGPQHWWPGDTPFEIMVGAVLTQNTAWTNVEKAIANLKAQDHLDPARITHASHEHLAQWLKPSGYFNIKAQRLQSFCAWYMAQGGLETLSTLDTHTLRQALLAVHGIGPETADDILLYAFHRPVFVIDAYTRRLFSRLGLIKGDEGYESLRHTFERALGSDNSKTDTHLFNEYHALIVNHAKNICRKQPLCTRCCLADICSSRSDWG